VVVVSWSCVDPRMHGPAVAGPWAGYTSGYFSSVWLAQLVKALAALTRVRSCVQEVRVLSRSRQA